MRARTSRASSSAWTVRAARSASAAGRAASAWARAASTPRSASAACRSSPGSVAPAIRADRSRLAGVVTIAAVVVVLDQITKLIALSRLSMGVPVIVVDGFIALTLVMNPGLAFGLLAGIPSSWRWVVGLLSLVALVVLLRVAVRVLPSGGWREQSAIGLIFGGAVGNLIDRTRFGAVVDFVDVYARDWHWPAFNVSDSGITVGGAALALVVMLERSPSGRA